jgi:hypothetical protein
LVCFIKVSCSSFISRELKSEYDAELPNEDRDLADPILFLDLSDLYDRVERPDTDGADGEDAKADCCLAMKELKESPSFAFCLTSNSRATVSSLSTRFFQQNSCTVEGT